MPVMIRTLIFGSVGFLSASARRCVFLHGAGQSLESVVTDIDTTEYWGGLEHIQYYTGGLCTEWAFAHTDTRQQAWTDSRPQRIFCEAAVGSGTGGVVRDTVVISHSMGNLIFAEALRNSMCSLDTASSMWLSTGAPWKGSKGADTVTAICANWDFVANLPFLGPHYCDDDKAHAAYVSLTTSNPALPGARSIAEKYVSASLCGSSTFGLVSASSKQLTFLDQVIVHYGEPNDGLVPVSSCELGNRTYQKDYHAVWSTSSTNHGDVSFRRGNGPALQNKIDSLANKPAQWLAAMGVQFFSEKPPLPGMTVAKLPNGHTETFPFNRRYEAVVRKGSAASYQVGGVKFLLGRSASSRTKVCDGEQVYSVTILCDDREVSRSPPQVGFDQDYALVISKGTWRCNTLAIAIDDENKVCDIEVFDVSVHYIFDEMKSILV